MTEPASASLATAAVVTTAAASALLPGIDANALVGAIAGGTLFVTSARDLSLVKRALYLVVSAAAGYVAAPGVASQLPGHSTGIAALLASALVVTVVTQLIERARTFDFSTLFNRGA
jgi:hypothetical protein